VVELDPVRGDLARQRPDLVLDAVEQLLGTPAVASA
jgi:hypothetical protein